MFILTKNHGKTEKKKPSSKTMLYTYEFNIHNRMPTQVYNFNISQYKTKKTKLLIIKVKVLTNIK